MTSRARSLAPQMSAPSVGSWRSSSTVGLTTLPPDRTGRRPWQAPAFRHVLAAGDTKVILDDRQNHHRET